MLRALLVPLVLAAALVLPGRAMAGAKITLDEDSSIDLGFRVQTLYRYSDFRDLSDGRDGTGHDFLLRRGRLRLGGSVTKWVDFFLQTEVQAGAGLGGDVRLIDAWVAVKPHKWAQIFMGENMAPTGREHLTSSGGLLLPDRPAITNYNLTWGLNARPQFNTANLPDGNLPLEGEVNVRDLGATLFGSGQLADNVSLKYYLGAYEGVQEDDDLEDTLRFAGRVQLNLFDAEPGYFNLGTYFGGKKTLALGVSHDRQDSIASNTGRGAVDYRWWEADLFVEWPVGPGSATFEAVYQDLDLDDAASLEANGATFDARVTQGSGASVQGGYFITALKLQPWVGYETWDSDAPSQLGDLGSFDVIKAGLTYAIKGHNAKVSAGYERLWTGEDIASTGEDTVNTFLVGFYVTY